MRKVASIKLADVTWKVSRERLEDPLRWRKPRRVFVRPTVDMFDQRTAFKDVADVFGVMAACPQHTFLVLTKWPKRAREFFSWVVDPDEKALRLPSRPLPNVHLGTSFEDQPTADARIPELLQCPAALHWVSAEPLLGPVDLYDAMRCDVADGRVGACVRWVVVGGESGPGARPFHVEWARSIVRLCAAAGAPVFVKQLGARPYCVRCDGSGRGDGPGGYCWGCGGADKDVRPLRDRKGGDPSEWPEDLRVREVPT